MPENDLNKLGQAVADSYAQYVYARLRKAEKSRCIDAPGAEFVLRHYLNPAELDQDEPPFAFESPVIDAIELIETYEDVALTRSAYLDALTAFNTARESLNKAV